MRSILAKIRSARLQKLTYKQLLIDFAVLIALPNFGFLLVSQWLNLDRAIINLDYVGCALIYLLLSRKLGILLTLLSLLIDTLALVTQVLPTPTLNDIFYLLGKTFYTSNLMIFMVMGITVVILAKTYALYWSQRRTSLLGSLLFFNLLLVGWHISNMTLLQDDLPDTSFYLKRGLHMVTSQSIDFVMLGSFEMRKRLGNDKVKLGPSLYNGSTQKLFERLESHQKLPKRILLIVVESWGVPVKKEIQDAILAPLNTVQTKQREYGTISFQGATVAGELRELCRKYPSAYNLELLEESSISGCLPRLLGEQGYNTYALHAATGAMYDRRSWYPKAGFQHMTFHESKEWPRVCYSFPGACDADLLPEVSNAFKINQPLFFYWLTLNSHTPYDKRDILEDHFNCEKFSVDPTTSSCRNFKLQAQFFSNLALLLRKPEMANTHVRVVGDHPAVIPDQQENHHYFAPKKIPWLMLETAPQQQTSTGDKTSSNDLSFAH